MFFKQDWIINGMTRNEDMMENNNQIDFTFW